MKLLERNKRTITYYLYKGKSEIQSGGYATGEYVLKYHPGVALRCMITSPKGSGSQVALLKGVTTGHAFGNLVEMDKTVLIEGTSCPIDENTVLCVDKTPSYDVQTEMPVYDYVVQRVSKSMNWTVLGISKVGI